VPSSGSVLVNLGRMNKIIEVNDQCCYALVEPEVSFFDLYNYCKERKLKVYPSCPSLGWGRILGNTLDRGWGYYTTWGALRCAMWARGESTPALHPT
jgi:hypothetical protein